MPNGRHHGWVSLPQSFNGGVETAADRQHRWKHEAECAFYFAGTAFEPEWNCTQETWDSLAGWPLADRGSDYICARDNLRAAVSADVSLMLFGWAQMDNPDSLLVALTCYSILIGLPRNLREASPRSVAAPMRPTTSYQSKCGISIRLS